MMYIINLWQTRKGKVKAKYTYQTYSSLKFGKPPKEEGSPPVNWLFSRCLQNFQNCKIIKPTGVKAQNLIIPEIPEEITISNTIYTWLPHLNYKCTCAGITQVHAFIHETIITCMWGKKKIYSLQPLFFWQKQKRERIYIVFKFGHPEKSGIVPENEFPSSHLQEEVKRYDDTDHRNRYKSFLAETYNSAKPLNFVNSKGILPVKFFLDNLLQKQILRLADKSLTYFFEWFQDMIWNNTFDNIIINTGHKIYHQQHKVQETNTRKWKENQQNCTWMLF